MATQVRPLRVTTYGPTRDTNYPVAAAKFAGRAPPVRDVGRTEQAIYSFTLPMTPRTERGLTDFFNRHSGSEKLTTEQTVRLTCDKLIGMVPLHVRRYFREAMVEEETETSPKSEEESPPLPPSRPPTPSTPESDKH